jgi:hypothetical protein
MKSNKAIGLLLLILAFSTVVGMIINNAAYWSIYNYAVIVVSALSGIVLLKQK